MHKLYEAQAILRHYAAKFDYDYTDSVIAGSWAANPFRANDIDIWVYRQGVEIIEPEYRDLGNIIAGATRYEMQLCRSGRKPKSYIAWYDTPVQIIETPYSLFNLLNRFDLSCCCYAVTHAGQLIAGDRATDPIEEEIKVLRNTASTGHRLVKLKERYGHTAHAWEADDELEIRF